MSRLDIYYLLHSEVIKTLEKMGHRRLALEVERLGPSHPIYDSLDKAFALYYSEYGGVNCRWLREEIKKNWHHVVEVVLPNLLRQILPGEKPAGSTAPPPLGAEKAKAVEK